MNTLRLSKSTARLLAFLLLLCASGSSQGFVLCWGHDDHMHIEPSFNGVDCGHFPRSTVKENDHAYVAADSPFSTSPCYCCTDLPLEFPHRWFNQNGCSTNTPHGKNAINLAALLPSSYRPFSRGLHADRLLTATMNGHATVSQIISISLRI